MFTPSLAVLWLLPALQLGLFGFFFADAMTGTLWYDDGVLCLCCAAGLAGGAVYVHGFKLISSAMPTETRELAKPKVTGARRVYDTARAKPKARVSAGDADAADAAEAEEEEEGNGAARAREAAEKET